MKIFPTILMACALFFNVKSYAQEQDAETSVSSAVEETAEEGAAVDTTYDERVALAKQMHDLRPVRDQVEGAINQYAQTRPPAERETFKTAMRNVFNVTALEKISVDAYAETFTVEELRAMVEYYSKPEARTASAKTAQYGAIVYPEIVRMLDRAAIRLRAGE